MSMGDVSEHFSRSEFRCHGFGRRGHRTHDTPIDPALLVLLERIRAEHGGPVRVISGHRCPWWNAKVGGAGASTHRVGEAADLAVGVVTAKRARELGAVGVGYKTVRNVRWATHVDVRHARAATWSYD